MAGKDVKLTVTLSNASVSSPVTGAALPPMDGLTVAPPEGFVLKTPLHQTGACTFEVVYQIPGDAGAGEAVFTVSYAGSDDYLPAAGVSAAVTVTGKNTAAVTLTADSNAISYGRSVTCAAAVTKERIVLPGDETLTGDVRFYLDAVDDAGVLAVKNVGDALTVTLDRTALTAGTHTVYAVFGGNGQFDPARGSAVIEVSPLPLSWNTDALRAEKVFDGSREITVSGTLTAFGYLPGDTGTLTYRALAGTLSDPNVGERAVTVTAAEPHLSNSNYALPAPAVITGTVTAPVELPAPPAPQGTAYRLLQAGLDQVPAGLAKDPALDTPQKIAGAMSLAVRRQLPDAAEEQVQVFDVTLPYPAGTNARDFDFVVTHMFTTGDAAGTTETLIPTKTEEGLTFVVHSLSPIALGYTAIPAGDAHSVSTGDEVPAALWIAATLLSAAGLCTQIFYKRRSDRREEP